VTQPPLARVFFRSLGCAKNQVDSEVMLGALALGGYAIAERLEDADVAVVNTCSFIESAREESLAAILEVAEQRERGRLRGLVVAGCLPQRYGADLARELPEVDAFVGTAAFPEIVPILERALAGRRGGVYVEAGRTHLATEREPRLLVGPRHSAWLKLAEGCDRVCAFCAIPAIRGRFQSRTLDSLVREAGMLAQQGVRELGLVSQDTCSWGKDLPGRPRLPELVRALDDVPGLDWIRLHYLYPSAIGDDLLDAIAGAKRVLPYLDVPLQHASDPVLGAMRRGVTARRQAELVRRARERIPGVTLRTTFIVGFPGESDADFETLMRFVRETRFDRVGVFRYSDEESTTAARHAEKVPAAVARRRFRALTALAAKIAQEKLAALVGAEASALVDRAAGGRAAGRLASQAPEVDGRVILRGSARPGEMVRVRITRARAPDLEAEIAGREAGCAA
jgi:ribosomal protein S12 methylthiotransferase